MTGLDDTATRLVPAIVVPFRRWGPNQVARRRLKEAW